ncbi:MAG: GNAT family N-acetyltransferase [Bacteroidales bacterium]|nr:GNAT family N-acetyltransferase [Bacteroidales bacterium]
MLQKQLISDLIIRNKDNQYNLWPEITTDQIRNLKLHQFINDERLGETFIFEKDEKCYLYFQVHNLEWDTNHFGFKCGAIKNFYIDDELGFLEIDEIIKKIQPLFNKYLKSSNFKFIFADICSQNKNGNYFIQSLKFQFILNWIDGFWNSKDKIKVNQNISVSEIKDEEIEIISHIASKSYYKSGRFYSDRRFDTVKVDKLYDSIIKNSHRSGDIILVLHENSFPIGVFVTKKIAKYEIFNKLKVAHLRFLVIDENHRGLNAGYNIFTSTLDYLQSKCDLVITGLESHNLVSLNLHIKVGFKFNYSHNAYHLWRT